MNLQARLQICTWTRFFEQIVWRFFELYLLYFKSILWTKNLYKLVLIFNSFYGWVDVLLSTYMRMNISIKKFWLAVLYSRWYFNGAFSVFFYILKQVQKLMFIVVYYITFYNAIILFLRFQMISKLPIKARPFENMLINIWLWYWWTQLKIQSKMHQFTEWCTLRTDRSKNGKIVLGIFWVTRIYVLVTRISPNTLL